MSQLRPELVAEWHPLKNGLLKPSDVTPYSHKKCWWVCPRGHEYFAIIEHRTKGSGCPYCSNHKIMPGFNDLATLKPDILSEWNWERNIDVLPSQIASQSSRIVWWRCEHGHEYDMKVSIKVANGYGCPICSGKRVLEGYNDLASQRPDLVEQWDMDRNGLLTPQQVTCGSHKKVWWLCEHGHSWSMPVHNRTTQNQGCPFCSGKKAWPGFNDFATWHPELVRFWDVERNADVTPQSVTYGSSLRVWWKCGKGHSYDMSVVEKHRGYGCPICSRARLTGENNFAVLHSDLLREWDYDKNTIDPASIASYSKQKIWWVCSLGHSYQMTPGDRVAGHGCSVCNQSRRTSFFEQAIAFYLKSRFMVEQRAKVSGREIDVFLPELNIGIEYDGAFYHSGEEAKCREERKNDVLRSLGIRLIRVKENKDNECVAGDVIYHRANYKFEGVSYVMARLAEKLSVVCDEPITFDVDVARDKGQIVQAYEVERDENSLEVLYPHVAAKWNYSKNEGMSPRMFTAKSGHRVWWKCPTCGNEWYGPIEHQVNGKCANNDFCPKCVRAKNKELLKGRYSLKENFPVLVQEWNTEKNGSLRPEDVTPGSKTVVWWHCSICGREWQSSIKTRTVRGECGCRKCKLKAKAAIRKQQELERTGGKRSFHVYSNSRPIIQYTRDGQCVARYKSLSEAIGLSGVSSVRKCLIGKQSQAGGYVWRYEDYIAKNVVCKDE